MIKLTVGTVLMVLALVHRSYAGDEEATADDPCPSGYFLSSETSTCQTKTPQPSTVVRRDEASDNAFGAAIVLLACCIFVASSSWYFQSIKRQRKKRDAAEKAAMPPEIPPPVVVIHLDGNKMPLPPVGAYGCGDGQVAAAGFVRDSLPAYLGTVPPQATSTYAPGDPSQAPYGPPSSQPTYSFGPPLPYEVEKADDVVTK